MHCLLKTHFSTGRNRTQPAGDINGQRTEPVATSSSNTSSRVPPSGVSVKSWTQSTAGVRNSQSRPTSARSVQSQRSQRSLSQGQTRRLPQHSVPEPDGSEQRSVQSPTEVQSMRSSSGSRSVDANSPLCVTDVPGIGRASRVSHLVHDDIILEDLKLFFLGVV